MGGTNDPSNLVELSVLEHAEAHRQLYLKHNKEEDRLAWLALSGQASKEQIVKEGKKIGRQNANESLEKRYGPDWRRVVSQKGRAALQDILEVDPDYLKKRNKKSFLNKKHTDETKEKMSQSAKGKGQGEKNSQFGTYWITNGVENKKIKKTDTIPLGWYKGRNL
jgi:hypothetical protein